MSVSNIKNDLIKRYEKIIDDEKPVIPVKKDLKDSKDIAKILCSDLKMSKKGYGDVISLIEKYPNFNDYLGLSDNVSIACLCYYVMQDYYNGTIRLEDYKVFTQLGITYKDYADVITILFFIDFAKHIRN